MSIHVFWYMWGSWNTGQLYSQFPESFCHKWVIHFIKFFSYYLYRENCFFSLYFINMKCYMDLILNVKPILSSLESTSMFRKVLGLYFSFLIMSFLDLLPGMCCSKKILISWGTFSLLPVLLWKSLCKINAVYSSTI